MPRKGEERGKGVVAEREGRPDEGEVLSEITTTICQGLALGREGTHTVLRRCCYVVSTDIWRGRGA